MLKINENYKNLKESYLFAGIAKRVAEYSAKNPDKKMLRDRMEKFTSEIKSADGYIYGLIEKNYKVFRMLNKLHMNEKVYQKVFIPMVHLIRK